MSRIGADNTRYRARKRNNVVMLSVSALALSFGLFWLVWILATLLYEGGTALAKATLRRKPTAAAATPSSASRVQPHFEIQPKA